MLQNMVSVNKRHLSIVFNPHSMPSVFGQIVETSDTESELSSFGELAKEYASLHEFVLADIGAELHDPLRHVVDSVLD